MTFSIENVSIETLNIEFSNRVQQMATIKHKLLQHATYNMKRSANAACNGLESLQEKKKEKGEIVQHDVYIARYCVENSNKKGDR